MLDHEISGVIFPYSMALILQYILNYEDMKIMEIV